MALAARPYAITGRPSHRHRKGVRPAQAVTRSKVFLLDVGSTIRGVGLTFDLRAWSLLVVGSVVGESRGAGGCAAVRRLRQDPRMLSTDEVREDYDAWLARQALVPRTRSAYRRCVLKLLEHLVVGDELETSLAPAGDHDRRAALADWRRRLVDRRLARSTVNLALAAATSLLDSRALASPAVRRVVLTRPSRGHCRRSSCARCSARPTGSPPVAIARSSSC